MNAIELQGLTKRFGSVTALDDVSFAVREDEIFGFLGPNGAGKSTTIGLLLDFVRPTAGSATVLGHDAQQESRAVRQRTGLLSDRYSLYDRLTGRQHLEFAIRAKDVDDDPSELLARVGLEDAADRKAAEYSTGMGQRLMLAAALVGEPDLLILDEPSTGLDPRAAKKMRDLIETERDRGATVFFSSHSLEQVEATADRVAILNDGRLVALDTIGGLRSTMGSSTRLRVQVDRPDGAALSAVRDLDGVWAVDPEGHTLSVECDRDAKVRIITTLDAHDVDVIDFTTDERSLEAVFMNYTDEGTGSKPDQEANR
ncbi:ABC transporter ATP-binding protein [Halovivax gelatinilyticus]|uniref:ABC transporter ATP-binding protein n=1 Tax=Halovivax gelatinilyticus TaxID=2961597 RepID=UPI0020CA7EA4|nr:ABC transporter ATP-binding protein [Halovivax gelatinilyticus]